jgi:GNAT superfamily N-acetyltransferase
MKQLCSETQLQDLVQEIKEKRGTIFTNFYSDTEKTASWIRKGHLYFDKTEAGVLLYRRNEGFSHVYFFAGALGDLETLLLSHSTDEKLVTDIIGKPQSTAAIVQLFSNAGFALRTTLQRFVRFNTGSSQFFQPSDEVNTATSNETGELTVLFQDNFDPLSEQVPTLEEVESLVAEGKVLIVRDKTRIKGFLVRTFTGQTTMLNNFLVRADFRGEKIGSRLLKHYIFEARDTKRMMLWVKSDNETAINVYEIHGYKKEDLVDYILTKEPWTK